MPLEFKPKYDKIVELMLYLAHKRPGADKYQAVKFFYFADREHLIRYGRPITNETYYALHYGPVASTVLDLLNGDSWTFQKLGLERLPFETTISDNTTIIGKPGREVKRELFSKSDLVVFDEVIEKYKDASFDDLFKATHEHYAWRHAWNARRQGNRAEMYYDEMIDDEQKRAALLEDLLPVASKM
ncbi:MAG: Panacea domain-containing protein [Bradyrhizobium sp.]